jgi:GNAT superfamily N-acetyltransferase
MSSTKNKKIKIIHVIDPYNMVYLRKFIEIYREAFSGAPYFETYTTEEIVNEIWFPHIQHGCLVMAMVDNEIVGLGCSMVATRWTHDESFEGFLEDNKKKLPTLPNKICMMTELAVLEEYRNMGVGYELIGFRKKCAKKQGLFHYMMRTASEGSNSIHMYEKIGAQKIHGMIQNVSNHAMKTKSRSRKRIYLSGSL